MLPNPMIPALIPVDKDKYNALRPLTTGMSREDWVGDIWLIYVHRV